MLFSDRYAEAKVKDKGGKVILMGITGSTAYGMATEHSDKDILGVFVYPVERILGLKRHKETIDGTSPDFCFHEVEKFMRLAMKCNPTILELLFLDEYTMVAPEGQRLIDIREAFLSKTIFNSYGGYAISQARKLSRRVDGEFSGRVKGRYSKHGRHCFRLLQQGRELLETGNLTIKVKNREELFAIREMEPNDLVTRFEQAYEEFKNIKTGLPDSPDYDRINKILLEIRKAN